MDESFSRLEKRIENISEKVEKLDDKVARVEYWRVGNGTKENSADSRISWLMNNAITKANMDIVVHDVVKEVLRKRKENDTADWNKWVQTILLIVTTVGVFYSLIV